VETQSVRGSRQAVSRAYKLYSPVQRADDIEVVIPAVAGEKQFKYCVQVKLVNPRIVAEGYKIGDSGFTNYLLFADDLVKA
jgi:hypothetical protein